MDINFVLKKYGTQKYFNTHYFKSEKINYTEIQVIKRTIVSLLQCLLVFLMVTAETILSLSFASSGCDVNTNPASQPRAPSTRFEQIL